MMNQREALGANGSGRRWGSIDVFRSITMLFMLFVNDSAGMAGLPDWLRHATAAEDMLGFSDLMFPAFLFCVGMSVFMALSRRVQRGDDVRSILWHVFRRTLALVVMGLFALNTQAWPHLSRPMFEVLMVVGFFLTWNVCPSPRWHAGLKIAGAVLLLVMVIGCDLWGTPFETGWWGILGLIGWTYMVCAVVFLLARGKLRWLVVACLVVQLIALVGATDWLPEGRFMHVLTLPFIPGGWGHHALGVTGITAAALMTQLDGRPRRLFLILLAAGLAFFLFGCLAHTAWPISKIHCTPTWVYFCLAIYCPILGGLHWLVDVKGKGGWFRVLRPAATATLTCYTVPYLFYPLTELIGVWYPEPFNAGVWGAVRSLVFSLAVIGLVALLQRRMLTLKL